MGTLLAMGAHAVWLALLISLPLMLLSLVVGLLVALVQAATQVQDSSIGYVPKAVVVSIAVLALGPWMFSQLIQFTEHTWSRLP